MQLLFLSVPKLPRAADATQITSIHLTTGTSSCIYHSIPVTLPESHNCSVQSLYLGEKKSSFLEIKLLPGNILLSIEMLSSSKVNILIAPITFKVTNIRQQASSSRQMLPTHLLWWTDRGNGSALLTSSLVKILKLLLPQSDLDVFHHWSILKSYYCGFIVS